ncbi:MAG: hypothetical protein J3Q66DRAFT_376195 [Benniella sp.]|nr:MAG: hypothetical protein J3Q66DRAFT_376195 [Benniella sp.]
MDTYKHIQPMPFPPSQRPFSEAVLRGRSQRPFSEAVLRGFSDRLQADASSADTSIDISKWATFATRWAFCDLLAGLVDSPTRTVELNQVCQQMLHQRLTIGIQNHDTEEEAAAVEKIKNITQKDLESFQQQVFSSQALARLLSAHGYWRSQTGPLPRPKNARSWQTCWIAHFWQRLQDSILPHDSHQSRGEKPFLERDLGLHRTHPLVGQSYSDHSNNCCTSYCCGGSSISVGVDWSRGPTVTSSGSHGLLSYLASPINQEPWPPCHTDPSPSLEVLQLIFLDHMSNHMRSYGQGRVSPAVGSTSGKTKKTNQGLAEDAKELLNDLRSVIPQKSSLRLSWLQRIMDVLVLMSSQDESFERGVILLLKGAVLLWWDEQDIGTHGYREVKGRGRIDDQDQVSVKASSTKDGDMEASLGRKLDMISRDEIGQCDWMIAGQDEEALQPLVFERLAALTRLKMLEILTPIPNSRRSMLGFRLECGLGQLAHWQHLSVLRFSMEWYNINTPQVGMDDVAWMGLDSSRRLNQDRDFDAAGNLPRKKILAMADDHLEHGDAKPIAKIGSRPTAQVAPEAVPDHSAETHGRLGTQRTELGVDLESRSCTV